MKRENFWIEEVQLNGTRDNQNYRNLNRFRGGFGFKAHRLVYHSTLGVRVIKKKKKTLPNV